MVINTIVAESLDELAEKIKAKDIKNINQAVFEVLKSEIKDIKPILFNGDNYTKEWEAEAKKEVCRMKKQPPAL